MNWEKDMQRRHALSPALGGWCIGVLAGVLALFVTGAYTSGLSGADEPAHFLNSYFISTYLRGHTGANPLAFATDFYIHYPKISIGHWPPGYYGLVGLLFMVVPPTIQSALLINLVVSALPSAAVAVMIARLWNRRAAFLGAGLYALTPLALEGQVYFMLDQILAACCIGATMVWIAYAARPAWRSALVFAGLCSFAVLVKGNGWLLVFVPLYHIILTGKWRLLTLPHVYGAALAAALVVIPWYWLTSHIAADGFNYQAGLDYAALALSASAGHLVSNVGWVGMLLAALAMVAEYRKRLQHPARWSVVSGCLSLILATLTLQSLVPVDIVSRYMAPALPAVLVLAMLGLRHVCDAMSNYASAAAGVAAAIALTGFITAPGVSHLATRPTKPDYQIAKVMPLLATHLPHDVVMIDGVSNAEGAFIAEMALQDPALRHYALRTSNLFAKTNFMGSRYGLKFPDPESVLAETRRLGVHNIVIVRTGPNPAFPHSQQLLDALKLPASPFRRIALFQHRGGTGTTEVYESAVEAMPDLNAVRELGIPGKVSTVMKTRL
jgi:hypothetical protein